MLRKNKLKGETISALTVSSQTLSSLCKNFDFNLTEKYQNFGKVSEIRALLPFFVFYPTSRSINFVLQFPLQ